ncbi:MAG: hypothetical protein PHZ04_05055 [Patescibacteria group bacterium]|nr:hypothetical protein [Patescibacteria group bacterium]MDD5294591.1 hypothetical protein [Patescibacteria group bacterium]MDD5554093.1 hypothetical protein [Patescibacteria group bacterium]
MGVKDLMGNAKNLTDYEFERKLNELVRTNYRYSNLNDKNKKIILDLVKKYKSYLRKGIGISSVNLRNESYRLYQNRLKLGLTEGDLDDIKEILGELRS